MKLLCFLFGHDWWQTSRRYKEFPVSPRLDLALEMCIPGVWMKTVKCNRCGKEETWTETSMRPFLTKGW